MQPTRRDTFLAGLLATPLGLGCIIAFTWFSSIYANCITLPCALNAAWQVYFFPIFFGLLFLAMGVYFLFTSVRNRT